MTYEKTIQFRYSVANSLASRSGCTKCGEMSTSPENSDKWCRLHDSDRGPLRCHS